jgi:RNA 2',3'-cyclic 3'-phosphodiesterase
MRRRHPRCSIGIPVPTLVAMALEEMQPSHRSVELASWDQFHITLQLLGEQDIEAVFAAIGTLRCPAFDLKLTRLGTFESPGEDTLLWAGADPDPALSFLRRELAESLKSIRYVHDHHPYVPHITLGWAKPAFDPDRFLDQAFAPATIPVHAIDLYSATFIDDQPHCQTLKTIPLSG